MKGGSWNIEASGKVVAVDKQGKPAPLPKKFDEKGKEIPYTPPKLVAPPRPPEPKGQGPKGDAVKVKE